MLEGLSQNILDCTSSQGLLHSPREGRASQNMTEWDGIFWQPGRWGLISWLREWTFSYAKLLGSLMHTHYINTDFDPHNNLYISLSFKFYVYGCIPLNTLWDSVKPSQVWNLILFSPYPLVVNKAGFVYQYLRPCGFYSLWTLPTVCFCTSHSFDLPCPMHTRLPHPYFWPGQLSMPGCYPCQS